MDTQLLNQVFTFVNMDDLEEGIAPEGAVITKTVKEMLDIINRGEIHTNDWICYDEHDWIEGMCEWTGYGVIFKSGQKFVNINTKNIITLTTDTQPICNGNHSIVDNKILYDLNRFYPVV